VLGSEAIIEREDANARANGDACNERRVLARGAGDEAAAVEIEDEPPLIVLVGERPISLDASLRCVGMSKVVIHAMYERIIRTIVSNAKLQDGRRGASEVRIGAPSTPAGAHWGANASSGSAACHLRPAAESRRADLAPDPHAGCGLARLKAKNTRLGKADA
jgi:hypothetical protein